VSTGEAYTLVQSLTRRFALAELQASLEAKEPQPQLEDGGAMSLPTRPPQVASQAASQTALPTAPWQPWVPESSGHGLDFEHQCFLGISLMLQRAPAIIRLPSFAGAVRTWAPAARLPEGDKALDLDAGRTMSEDARRRLTDVGAILSKANPVGLGPRGTSGRPWEWVDNLSLLLGEDQDKGEPRREIGAVESPEPHFLPSSDIEAVAMDAAPAPMPWAIEQVEHLKSEASSTTTSAFAEAIATVPEGLNNGRASALDNSDRQIDTGLGGLFYLINMGLFLNLYGDFTTPIEPGIDLPLWDFVTLLGQKLLGGAMQDDPVWGLLAHLAGRDEHVAAGADFKPPDIWRLPVAWLAPFHEEAIWHWQGNDGRLQVRHPAQFLVLDVPLQQADLTRQLRYALQDYGTDLTVEPQPEFVVASAGGTTALERWLGWLMPYVRARLRRALQVVDPDELAQIVCTHHARIFVSATHLDILLALDALPIEIRLAGLDRNPGWVPAAGRFIAFHFE
jgi:hypothetical protein